MLVVLYTTFKVRQSNIERTSILSDIYDSQISCLRKSFSDKMSNLSIGEEV